MSLQVLDEAYIEFAGEESKLKWVLKHDNLVVLRTFSKSAGRLNETLGVGAAALDTLTFVGLWSGQYHDTLGSLHGKLQGDVCWTVEFEPSVV